MTHYGSVAHETLEGYEVRGRPSRSEEERVDLFALKRAAIECARALGELGWVDVACAELRKYDDEFDRIPIKWQKGG